MTFPIARTADYASRVEARDHTAVVASLRPFFEARSVAVIGASSRRGTIGGELFRNILDGRLRGRRLPRESNGESVAGVRGYSSIADIPDPVDLAVVCVPAAAVLEAVRVRARRRRQGRLRHLGRVRGGRFRRGGAPARVCSRSIRAHGARLLGPNCLGISSAAVRLNATFASRSAPPGNIGFSSQSGALGLALLEAASPAASGCPHSSRSGTRRTSRRTTCSSGGRTIRRRTSCCSTSSRSEIRDDSGRSPAASRERSRFSRSRAGRRVPARARRARIPRRLPARRPRSTRSSTRRGSSERALSRSSSTSPTLALDAADASRTTRGSPDERRRSRDPVCGCLRGGRAGATAARRGDGSSDRAAAAGRSESRQSGRHARLGVRPTRTSRSCRFCWPTPRSMR